MKTTEHKETGAPMHVYEIAYLVVPTVSEDKVAEEVSAIRSMLESAGASIIADGFPQLQPLAYTIERSFESKKQKFNEGYFGWVKFDLPVAAITNVKHDLDKKPNILRSLIMKTVRENTMYSAREIEVAEGENGEVADASSKKEMDKSIDALVIS